MGSRLPKSLLCLYKYGQFISGLKLSMATSANMERCVLYIDGPETPEVGGACAPPQVLGYQLTLFGPRGQIMPVILLVPPHIFGRCGVSVVKYGTRTQYIEIYAGLCTLEFQV